MPKNNYFSSTGTRLGFRSGLEDKNALFLRERGVEVQYEQFKLTYTPPIKRYTPDFILPNGIVIETKGWFRSSDRSKHKLIKKQYPLLDLRFVFSAPHSKIGKKSSTTYALWCEREGFLWAGETIPEEWLKEELSPEALSATINVLNWTPPA